MPAPTTYLAIPEPCHEDWAQMTPTACGRFCQACQKDVLDFTDHSPADILAVLRARPEGSVCGRIPVDTLADSRHQADAATTRTYRPGNARLRRVLTALILPLLAPAAGAAPLPPAPAQAAAPAVAPRPRQVVVVRVVEAATNQGISSARVQLWRLGAPLLTVQTEIDGSVQMPVEAEYWADPLLLTAEVPGFPRAELAFTPAQVAGVLALPMARGPVTLPAVRKEEVYVEERRSYYTGAVALISTQPVGPPQRASWLRRAVVYPPLRLFLRVKRGCQNGWYRLQN